MSSKNKKFNDQWNHGYRMTIGEIKHKKVQLQNESKKIQKEINDLKKELKKAQNEGFEYYDYIAAGDDLEKLHKKQVKIEKEIDETNDAIRTQWIEHKNEYPANQSPY